MARVLQHALLALVAEKPRSGYDLARMFEQTLSHAWSAGHSQIYPELMRLERDGLIRQTGSGPRRRKSYEATAAGRREVRRWLLETPPTHASRNELALRTFFLWLLPPEEQEELLLSERPYHAELLEQFEELAAGPGWDSPPARSGRIALEFGILYERAVLEWIDWAVSSIRADAGRKRADRGERAASRRRR